MTTQEAQTIINNIKDHEDPKYKEAKAFLDNQQVEGKKEEPKKSFKEKAKAVKDKLVMSPEEMQKMTSERDDVKNAARRSEIANPSVGIVDRVMGNVTGRNEDILDPWAVKAKDLNSDGSMAEKELKLGNETNGNFIGAETSEGGNGGSGSTKLDKKTQSFMDKQNAIANTAEDTEKARNEKQLKERWDLTNKNADEMVKSMRNVDDHYLDNLPKFLYKRYKDGEFGEPGSKDAKARLGYFIMNGVQNTLKGLSNSFAANAGRAPIFNDVTTDYDKLQNTNFANAMNNRWNKYQQETNAAMDLAKKRGMSEEDLQNSIATISSNARLQNAVNMMNEEQKVFAFNVLAEIGDDLGSMDDKKFVDTLMGMSAMGKDLDPKEAAAMLMYRFGKDSDVVNAFLSKLGFDIRK